MKKKLLGLMLFLIAPGRPGSADGAPARPFILNDSASPRNILRHAAENARGVPDVAAPQETDGRRIDVRQMLIDLETISHDEMEGRLTGRRGNKLAGDYIQQAFVKHGLKPFGDSYEMPFYMAGGALTGTNLAGYIPGAAAPPLGPKSHIVISAHYDHIGSLSPVEGDTIANGADDNASGVAGLLALAGYFASHPPVHPIIFLATDAEELGALGSAAFVRDPPLGIGREDMLANVNLDMISRSKKNELGGATVDSFLWRYVEDVRPTSPVSLQRIYDYWLMRTDSEPFYLHGIPTVSFSVEEHPDYHKPGDEFERIHPEFYAGAVETILDVILNIDQNMLYTVEHVPRPPLRHGGHGH